MKRILVCGGRTYSDGPALIAEIQKHCEWTEPDDFGNTLPTGIVIIHGRARGADDIADQWAVNNDIPIEEYPAKWDLLGKRAGIIRNIEMLEQSKPDLVIATKGGDGTAHMVGIARRAGITVIKVGWDD